MKGLLGFRVLVLTILLVTPCHAAADEIRIILGTVVQTPDSNGHLTMEGTDGLKMEASLISAYSSIFRWASCDLYPCAPGNVLDLRSGYGGLALASGEVTIQGRTYSLFFGAPDGARVELLFDAAVVLPEIPPEYTSGDTLELSVPFVFSGSLEVSSRHDAGTFDVFELSGSGVATVRLYPHPFFGNSWIVESVTYEFLPRPNLTER